MNYHKDKIISPSIYQELRGLEVKKNGKVEHSELTHDDQIFSYLMALYVWYEGKNLKELFGIDKSGIRTEMDTDDIVEMNDINELVDITSEIEYINRDDTDKNKLEQQMQLMQKNKGVLFSEFVEKRRKEEEELLKQMLLNPVNRQAYANKYHLNPEDVSIDQDYNGDGNLSSLPNSLFTDFNTDYDDVSSDSIYARYRQGSSNPYNQDMDDNGLQ